VQALDAQPPSRPPSGVVLGAGVVLAVLSISTAAILFRESEAPTLVKAFYRLAIATVILGAWAIAHPRSRSDLASLSRRDILGLSGVGIVLAVHFATWIESLELTSVAASVTLVTLHPIFVGLVSARLYGEGLPPTAVGGVLLAIVGGSIIAYGDGLRGPDPLLGDALALVGALAAAAYFLAGRGYRRRLSLLAYVVPVYAVCSIALLVMAVVAGNALTGYDAREWSIFVALAVVPMILGHTVLNFALRYVTAPIIATTVLGEPVGSSILAYLVLSEVPATSTIVGAALVLTGIGVVVARDRRRRAAELAS